MILYLELLGVGPVKKNTLYYYYYYCMTQLYPKALIMGFVMFLLVLVLRAGMDSVQRWPALTLYYQSPASVPLVSLTPRMRVFGRLLAVNARQ